MYKCACKSWIFFSYFFSYFTASRIGYISQSSRITVWSLYSYILKTPLLAKTSSLRLTYYNNLTRISLSQITPHTSTRTVYTRKLRFGTSLFPFATRMGAIKPRRKFKQKLYRLLWDFNKRFMICFTCTSAESKWIQGIPRVYRIPTSTRRLKCNIWLTLYNGRYN